jgi:hypothetical protein
MAPGSGLILRIPAVHVGVEVGQIIALAAMMALLSGWPRSICQGPRRPGVPSATHVGACEIYGIRSASPGAGRARR